MTKEQWKVQFRDVRVGKSGVGSKGSSEVARLNYKATSGVDLVSTPRITTTVLNAYAKDTGSIVNELANVKPTNFGPRQNGFNVLYVPDALYQNPSNSSMTLTNHG